MSKGQPDFWDRVARRYAGMAMRNPEAWEATLDLVRAHLGPGDRVLELGCGTGTTALELAGAVDTYVASDRSGEMIAIAGEKRARSGAGNLELCVGAPGAGTLPQGPFDAVLSFNLLHLLADRKAAFAEIRDLLVPGGLFISKTPCLGGAYRILQPAVTVLRLLGKAPRIGFLTPAGLGDEIANAGFRIIETGDYPRSPPSRFIVARRI